MKKTKVDPQVYYTISGMRVRLAENAQPDTLGFVRVVSIKDGKEWTYRLDTLSTTKPIKPKR